MILASSTYFSADYDEARAKFLAAAKAAGGRLASHQNPASGPDGGRLTTDIARFGPEKAERVLLIKSGTHGVEGFLGSGIEIGLIESGLMNRLPAGVACLMLHALNPYGFAWIRRTNEDNIDLNRNFIDHRQPYPQNLPYEALKDFICPRSWSDAARRGADEQLEAYGAQHGAAALQSAITAGQYKYADGVFYGGTQASWSNKLLTALSKEIAGEARHLAVIDLHSGLGPYGYGEIMNGHMPGLPAFQRIEDWFGGEATSYASGNSSSSVLTGDTLGGIERAMPGRTISGITLEYGTIPLREMVDAVRADNWLHVHGKLNSAEGRNIKRQIRDAFYPDKDDWKQMVWERGEDTTRRMLKGLAES